MHKLLNHIMSFSFINSCILYYLKLLFSDKIHTVCHMYPGMHSSIPTLIKVNDAGEGPCMHTAAFEKRCADDEWGYQQCRQNMLSPQ